MQFYEYLFVVIGILAAFLGKRERLLSKALILLFILYISSLYGFMWVRNSRYRGVILPLFIMFFSYGLWWFCEKVRGRYGAKAQGNL